MTFKIHNNNNIITVSPSPSPSPAFEYITSTDRPSKITINSAVNQQIELPGFALNITPSTTDSKIVLSIHIMGEWSTWPSQKGVIIQRKIGLTTDFLRPTAPSTQLHRGRIIANFNDAESGAMNNNNSTMESCSFIYVDKPNTTSEITYSLFLVNTEHDGDKADFSLNSTTTTGDQVTYEVGSSTFIVEERF